MLLNRESLKDRAFFGNAGIALPDYDVSAVADRTQEAPMWAHFGAGNLFRAYLLKTQQKLLNKGICDRGITAIVNADSDTMDVLYRPHDNLSMLCTLCPDGCVDQTVLGSLSEAVLSSNSVRLKQIFESESLQLVSFTITEKGYAIRGDEGVPNAPGNTMGQLVQGLLWRFLAGAYPLALVSMDNCSANGDKLKCTVQAIAKDWCKKGLAPEAFKRYIDSRDLSFPCTMIDKIVPRPSQEVQAKLSTLGFTDMGMTVTQKHTHIAPFVNAEPSEYLVIEDCFPNGRPKLEQAGILFADRKTVDACERMKVCACLNPVHTALAIFGCLLGFTKMAVEMDDESLRALAMGIGREGMAVTEDPGVLHPEDFFQEFIEKRLPNIYLGDDPRRIACDTSQKMAVRFGGTIRAYARANALDKLHYIPLVIAGWLRYLQGIDDQLKPFEISTDPMLADLKQRTLDAILSDNGIFGCDLIEIGLRDRILSLFSGMQDRGAVRKTLIDQTNTN